MPIMPIMSVADQISYSKHQVRCLDLRKDIC